MKAILIGDAVHRRLKMLVVESGDDTLSALATRILKAFLDRPGGAKADRRSKHGK